MAVEITGLYLQQSLNVAKGNDCWASAGADAAQAGFSISPCLGFFAITLCFSQHLSSALLALLPPPASSRGYSLGSVLSPPSSSLLFPCSLSPDASTLLESGLQALDSHEQPAACIF